MNSPPPAAQKVLVERLLSWPRVEARLSEYPAIARAFPLSLLRKRSEDAPYYCHYMAWRLGTFQDELLVQRLNQLIEHAEHLPNWGHEGALLKSGEFADFWSLVWQLQVAEYLSSQGSNVSWSAGGPDLSVDLGGQKLFIECYVYRKSFGVELFVQELLALLGGDLRVSHDLCLPLSLPNDRVSLSDELSCLMSPLLDSEGLAAKRQIARDCYPIVLSKARQGSLTISLEGPHAEAYDPSVLPHNVGDPTQYLQLALQEAANAKSNSNQLGCHRPNLVAVNYALSADAQLALARFRGMSQPLPNTCIGENIDAFAFAATGIDSALSKCDLKLVLAGSASHPAHAITVPAV